MTQATTSNDLPQITFELKFAALEEKFADLEQKYYDLHERAFKLTEKSTGEGSEVSISQVDKSQYR